MLVVSKSATGMPNKKPVAFHLQLSADSNCTDTRTSDAPMSPSWVLSISSVTDGDASDISPPPVYWENVRKARATHAGLISATFSGSFDLSPRPFGCTQVTLTISAAVQQETKGASVAKFSTVQVFKTAKGSIGSAEAKTGGHETTILSHCVWGVCSLWRTQLIPFGLSASFKFCRTCGFAMLKLSVPETTVPSLFL